MDNNDKNLPQSPAPAVTTPATSNLDAQLKALQLEEAQLRVEKARNAKGHEARENALKLRQLEAQVRAAELDVAKREREAEREKASHDEHMVYTLWDAVTTDTMKAAMTDLGRWSRRFPGKPLTLMLNSPGGAVVHGLALYDFVLKLRADGHHVTVIVLGQAASMGGILLQAGDKRIVGANSRVLIREVSAGTQGNIQSMSDAVIESQNLWSRLVRLLARRSSLSEAQIRSRALRKDWWLDAHETVALGFADELLATPDLPETIAPKAQVSALPSRSRRRRNKKNKQNQ